MPLSLSFSLSPFLPPSVTPLKQQMLSISESKSKRKCKIWRYIEKHTFRYVLGLSQVQNASNVNHNVTH